MASESSSRKINLLGYCLILSVDSTSSAWLLRFRGTFRPVRESGSFELSVLSKSGLSSSDEAEHKIVYAHHRDTEIAEKRIFSLSAEGLGTYGEDEKHFPFFPLFFSAHRDLIDLTEKFSQALYFYENLQKFSIGFTAPSMPSSVIWVATEKDEPREKKS